MSSFCALIDPVLENFRSISFARRAIPIAVLLPKATGNYHGIDIALLPPLSFLAGRMNVVVVDGAKRDGELIAHLQAKALGLCIPYMMGVGRRAAADKARLTCYEAEMLFRADPFRLTKGENAFVDLWTSSFGGWQTRHSFAFGGLTAGSTLRLDEGDGALLEVAHELGCDPRSV